MEKGLLIVGHGSRSLEAQSTFERVVNTVRQKVSYPIVEGASMEFSQPNIPASVKKMVECGIDEILIIPYFLYEGIHIKEDIPRIIRELSDIYKNITFKMGQPIGLDPLLPELIVKRVSEMEERKSIEKRK
ncbi:sirohydrochlorin chelatase [Garciella nitratireducens]|uniref:sirohydrochlorin chelatase n=1 Tax=Garciella nitratireducens TaxID=218205 RepID=UPI000DE81302|nr:CbiX/SirB N-terminal domain-containing protein [Garciella nitratireducens]RBP41565.1 sirohydrochlorin cobaltochelatase [Garciella nitratireducens]